MPIHRRSQFITNGNLESPVPSRKCQNLQETHSKCKKKPQNFTLAVSRAQDQIGDLGSMTLEVYPSVISRHHANTYLYVALMGSGHSTYWHFVGCWRKWQNLQETHSKCKKRQTSHRQYPELRAGWWRCSREVTTLPSEWMALPFPDKRLNAFVAPIRNIITPHLFKTTNLHSDRTLFNMLSIQRCQRILIIHCV